MIKLILSVFSVAFVVIYKGDMGLWTLERSRPARSEGPPATNQSVPPDKRSAGMDRNAVGDSCGMSKATRLQKSRPTKKLICERPLRPPQKGKSESKPWNKLTNMTRGGWYISSENSLLTGTVCLSLCAFMQMCTCVCEAGLCLCRALTLRPFILRGASFSLTFSIWPPEESYDNWAGPVFLGTITHIKDGETNKQTITLTAGSALSISNRCFKTNPMRWAIGSKGTGNGAVMWCVRIDRTGVEAQVRKLPSG